MNDKFKFRGKVYDCLPCAPDKDSGERTVEIPIVWEIVKNCSGKVLEVGNVLSLYHSTNHEIVDKFEKAEGVINEDIIDFQPEGEYDLIVSISTLEHVGWDEDPDLRKRVGGFPDRDPPKVLRAIEHLKSLLAPGGKLVVTLPLGYNSVLDGYLKSGEIAFSELYCLSRDVKDLSSNTWTEVSWDKVCDFDYPYICSNQGPDFVLGIDGPYIFVWFRTGGGFWFGLLSACYVVIGIINADRKAPSS